MKNCDLVSIIIPVYNMRPFLVEALNSVLQQTYSNLEIIIIDDGSTDGSGDICDEYAKRDNRICVVHQKNGGLSHARNVGLNMMTGDMVAFLDADDAYHPEFIMAMVGVMSRDKTDLVVCKYTIHHTNGDLTKQKHSSVKPSIESGIYDRFTALYSLADGIINQMVWNKLYRRELWNDIRFPEGHVHEDIDTIYKIINICGSISVISQQLYLRRKHTGTISETHSIQNINDWIMATMHFESFIRSNIPGIFTEKQLVRKQQLRLNHLISYYLLLFRDSNNRIFCEELRQQISKLSKQIGTEHFRPRQKYCYKMICSCPSLLRLIYPIHLHIHRFTRPIKIVILKAGNYFKLFVPESLLTVFRKRKMLQYRLDMLLFPWKMKRYCPCCGLKFDSFVEKDYLKHPEKFDLNRYKDVRQDVLCPNCKSLPRHRILSLWCEKYLKSFQSARILYFAPEKSMESWMRREKLSYVTADLYKNEDLRLDMQKTGLPDESYDIIIANHVLEHVDDFRLALKEMYRILRPKGCFICSFPMDPKIELLDEDPSVQNQEGRIRRFGQYDHRRVFGMKADQLLTEAGFDVETINGENYPEEILPIVGPADYDMNRLFCCRKPEG